MTDFPNNFDYLIYGTGVTESILSASLSVIGKNVLHIDNNSYYGGFNGCLRLNELENILNDWKEVQDLPINNDDNLFSNNITNLPFINLSWHVEKADSEVEINGKNSDDPNSCHITKEFIRQKMRGFEFEMIPKLVYCESQTVDALIQSDVTRYLEFKFISKFASFCDDKIVNIPINRSDIVKTRLFSLRQKRQLTSFLEWCFNVAPDDDLLIKYTNQPLYQLMRNEKNIDLFTENIIIQCLAIASPNVETMEGTMQIKRLLKSFNKFGPYPIMWPNYGSGEIPQAFCRMSAVFGGIYCLNTSIQSCTNQESLNGNGPDQGINDIIPISHRKLKLKLSNNSEVYTDKVICSKSYVNPSILKNPEAKSWVGRAILITNRSLLDKNREQNDILLLPLHMEQINRPVLLIELPTDRRGDSNDEYFVVHITAFSSTCLNPKELFSDVIGKLFDRYNTDPLLPVHESIKPAVFFECYFTLPDFTRVSVDTESHRNIAQNTVFVNSLLDNLEFEDCIKEARELFSVICPGEQFLPRPPNPEDIILLGDEPVPLGAPMSGDFPFESNVEPILLDSPVGPGDTSHETDIVTDQQNTALTTLIADMDFDDQQN